MSSSPDLSESDVRQMVRLLGETAALEGGHAEKKRYLMDGLCHIINVDSVSYTHLTLPTTPYV